MVSFSKNKFSSRVIASIVIVMSAVMFYTIPSVIAQESETLSLSPLNPAFLEYLQEPQILKVQRQTTDGHTLGFIPSPLDLSHLKGSLLDQVPRLVGAPISYDLHSQGKLTPVKDQGSCGSCWAFATYGSLESTLLSSETWDFSENNLKNTHGFDWSYCAGGNAGISTAYLARWSGPVDEMDDPYDASSNVSPSGLPVQKHVQEVLFIPDRANSLDNENIKQAVMTYGALYTTMYWGNSYYNDTNNTYYYKDASSANHAVAIVGWDDNFDKSKFNNPPAGNGAFIIRNSWGTAFGDQGYFYISYYDTQIGKSNVMFNGAEPFTNYSRVYQYDPLGRVNNLGYTNDDTAWFANIFTANANEQLSAVSFYTASLNSSYEIFIYRNVTSGPTSSSPAGTKSGTILMPGYHTITLDSPISLTSGQKFSVVVRLTTPGYNYPVALEYPISNYSSKATASAGQSYISYNGSSWSDITTISGCKQCNVCLKAFTTGGLSCTYSIEPINESFNASWGTGEVSVTAGTECSWTATNNNVPWITIISGSSGTGSGTVNYSVAANSGTSRIGTMTIAGQTFTVNQSAPAITVTSPNGRDIWPAGTSHSITWTYTGNPGTYVKIDLLKGGNLNSTITIRTSIGIAGSGSYKWTIPSNQRTGNYTIKVTSTSNNSYTDTSETFSISKRSYIGHTR